LIHSRQSIEGESVHPARLFFLTFWVMEDRVNRRFCVAPMMDCTDRHERYFLRLISQEIALYTEMITAAAILHGDLRKLLSFDEAEHPVALQLGGSDPSDMAAAARIGADCGYDEINLNVGCPSDRVQKRRQLNGSEADVW